ncbi:glycosyltransferase family 4 protein [Thermoleophilum album]|uniref:glycosyltransferase n=1 Tax=Thermoleophilum album TaxID=29539 RepID=UPI00237CCA30|nr:glycosyltransferase [Thermoleophilum album]WDT93049.1 glycosyltransferase family 4 protein [Thermoleophilum album]
MRLAVWFDAVACEVSASGRRELAVAGTSVQFARFALAVAERFDAAVVLMREAPEPDERFVSVPLPPSVTFVGLPHYPSLRQPWRVAAVVPHTLRRAVRALRASDVAWLFGPHPLLPLLLAGVRGETQVVLGTRMPGMDYWRARAEGFSGRAALPLLALLDHVYRERWRDLPMTVVGPAIAKLYRRRPDNTLVHFVSLVADREIEAAERRAAVTDRGARAGGGELVRLLCVGRLEPEKDPLLALDVFAELERRRPGAFELLWAGDGRLRDAVATAARERGLEARVTLLGDVEPHRLYELYGEVDLVLHTARVEGVPQALLEALGHGLPVVAGDVGGIRAAFGDTVDLVTERYPAAFADTVLAALASEQRDPARRRRRFAFAREHSLEQESARVAAFLRRAAVR